RAAARRSLPHRARGEPGGSVPLLPGPLDGRARAGPLVPGDQRAGEPDRSLALPRRGAGDGRRTAAARGAGSDRARAAGRGVLRAGGAGGPGVPRALVAARRRAARPPHGRARRGAAGARPSPGRDRSACRARGAAEPAAARALGQELVAQTRERAGQTIVAKDPWLFDVAWRRVAAAVDALIVREYAEEQAWGGTIERIVERPFERALADPDGGPALTLAGTPDRVDLFRDGAAIRRLRVVDYKMSRSPARYAARIDPAR